MSVVGFVAKQMAHMVLDTLYMTVIQLAAGREPWELIKEWKEDPVTTAVRYMSRFPGLGLWGSVSGQFLAQIIIQLAHGERGMSMSLGPVSLSAWESALKKFSKIPQDIRKGDMEGLVEDILASVVRAIPFAGGAMTRTVGQIANNAMHGDAMGPKRGGGGGSLSGGGGNRWFNQRIGKPSEEEMTNTRSRTAEDIFWRDTDMGHFMQIIKELGGVPTPQVSKPKLKSGTAAAQSLLQGAPIGSGTSQGTPSSPTPTQGNTGAPQATGAPQPVVGSDVTPDEDIVDQLDATNPTSLPEGL